MKKRCFLMFLGLVIILSLSSVFAQDITFGPSIRVDDDTTGQPQVRCGMATYGDSIIYIAWCDCRDHLHTGKNNIYFSSSFDGGRTWTKNLNITNNSTPDPDFPDMETDDAGNIYLVE